jgi:hypothetical protein
MDKDDDRDRQRQQANERVLGADELATLTSRNPVAPACAGGA